MSENENNSKKKKKSSGGGVFILIVIILAAVLLFIWKFGIGGGTGGGISQGDGDSTGSAASELSEETLASEETAEESLSGSENSEDGTINITVRDSAILVNGGEVEGSEGLREYILSVNTADTEYVLIDERAVKSAYDEAQAVLDELGCKYSQAVADIAEDAAAESTDGEN